MAVGPAIELKTAPGVTRTPDRRIRNPLLYPAELRAPNELKVVVRIALAILITSGAITLAEAKANHRSRMNSLFVIAPYKYEGMWVFDDPAVGLAREPFIAGIDSMIDKMVAEIPNAQRGFRAIFSASPFPGADYKLEWRRQEGGGNWYYNDRFKMEGWLCPALFKYFAEAPREIYVKAEPK
jgi:hypothetical protein